MVPLKQRMVESKVNVSVTSDCSCQFSWKVTYKIGITLRYPFLTHYELFSKFTADLWKFLHQIRELDRIRVFMQLLQKITFHQNLHCYSILPVFMVPLARKWKYHTYPQCLCLVLHHLSSSWMSIWMASYRNLHGACSQIQHTCMKRW